MEDHRNRIIHAKNRYRTLRDRLNNDLREDLGSEERLAAGTLYEDIPDTILAPLRGLEEALQEASKKRASSATPSDYMSTVLSQQSSALDDLEEDLTAYEATTDILTGEDSEE